MKTNVAEKSSVAPTTGRGMTAKSAAALGTNARPANIAAIAHATRRLVTPVAAARPTQLVVVLRPIVPSRPAVVVPSPLARTPPASDPRFGRAHSASLVF